MYELVYNSIADPRDIDEADLKGILAASRQHNQLRGITGFLLYHRGEFVQLLEGERDTVRQVYFDYIVRDPRHTNVNLCWIVKSGRAVFATGRWLSTGLSRRCTEKTPGLTGVYRQRGGGTGFVRSVVNRAQAAVQYLRTDRSGVIFRCVTDGHTLTQACRHSLLPAWKF